MEAYQTLEHEWAKFNDLDPAGMVACSSGTAALHLALEAFRLPLGSEVVTSDFNMIAVPRAIAMAGLKPVFVDCDERLLIDPYLADQAAEDAYDGVGNCEWKVGRCISAVIAVNIYGREYDVFRVRKATEGYGIKVIEDLAECHGIKPSYNADAAAWSFYRNKIIAGEEGGAVWFRDQAHAALARQLRSLGFTDAHDFNHIPRGHNYRMSNAHADIIGQDFAWSTDVGLAQRRKIESWYDELCPPQYRQPPRQAPWVYDLRVRGMTGEQQNELVRSLQAVGIAARHGFKPMSHQPEFAKCKAHGPERMWNSCMAAKEVIYLPIQPGITTRESVRTAFVTIEKCLVRP